MALWGRGAALAITGLVGLSGATSATAATQIGATPTPTLTCGNDTLGFTVGVPAGSPSYTSPIDGVITSWSHRAAQPLRPLKFKVGRAAGGNLITVVGESPLTQPPGPGLHSFSAQIPVLAGDFIGFYWPFGGECAASASNQQNAFRFGDLEPGATAGFAPAEAFARKDVSAIVELDCDADTLGDETQDPDTSSCAPRTTRTASLEASKAKVKKKKKVTLSGAIAAPGAESACAASQTIDLQRGEEGSFETLQQLQTNGSGEFAIELKVKKTYEYRIQVPDSTTCTSALSNTERVKVKKKRKKN